MSFHLSCVLVGLGFPLKKRGEIVNGLKFIEKEFACLEFARFLFDN